jgi:hypothetical protein
MTLISVDKEIQSIKFVKNMNDKIKIDALKDAIITYNKGELSKEALQAVAKDAGRKVNIWDKKSERNIHYPIGDNRSRTGFCFDPRHKKGIFLNKIIKKSIWKTIEFVHKKLPQGYDNEIYIFDDERLNAIQDYLYAYLDSHAAHSQPRNTLYKQSVDISLSLMKEDIRYRSLVFDCFNKAHEIFKHFELTEGEKDNLKRWK